MKRTLIKNARIVNPARREDFIGDILIENDKIARVKEKIEIIDESLEEIDATGLIAAPGLVDMHVHLRDPGFTDKEDITTAAKAAAAGGVTSLLAMPNTKPEVDNPETVRYVIENGAKTDINIYTSACITKKLAGEELCDFTALKEAGAIALTDDGRPVIRGDHLVEALEQAEKLDMIVCAHCEDLSIADGGLMNYGEVSKKLGVKGINRASEDMDTAREIAAAMATNTHIHICHVSTKGSAELIRAAKAMGVSVSAETAPHYLLLTDKELLSEDADYRMNPPLRTEEDRLAMISALRDGTIDAIATDHAPHTVSEKADFKTAPNGSIGMETSLAATLTAVGDKLSMLEIISKMSYNPAKLLGIKAGTLNVGEQADIVLFDPAESFKVDPKALHGKSRNTPFKNMELTGKVKLTMCGGKTIYKDER